MAENAVSPPFDSRAFTSECRSFTVAKSVGTIHIANQAQRMCREVAAA